MRRLRCAAMLALVGAVSLAVVGCARGRNIVLRPTAPVQPPRGLIFTQQKAPLAFTGEIPDVVPPTHRDAPAPGLLGAAQPRVAQITPRTKCGVAEASNVVLYYQFLSIGWGDASIEAAARNAGITRIAFADYEFFTILGFYNRMKVFVYGE